MIFVLGLLLWIGVWLLLRPRYTQIELVVKVPPQTPLEKVRIIGNIPAFGEWVEHSCKPGIIQENSVICDLRLPIGQLVEFKVTLGDWSSVQKGPGYEDTDNFRVIADGKIKQYSFEVYAFGGQQKRFSKPGMLGHFDALPSFESKLLGDSRPILIWLPPSYSTEPGRRYPVLYMHDGNNLFDARTAFGGVEWQVDETSETLIQQGLMEEIIVVGIYNSIARLDEYTPTTCQHHGGGRGREYLRFMVEELKPFINQRYRTITDPNKTGIMGSSLGGLISLWAGFEYPEEFGLIGSVSPSLWWDHRYMLKKYMPSKSPSGQKIWLDMGTREGMNRKGVSTALQDTRDMDKLLTSLGFVQGKNLFYFEHQGAYHNEASWASRLHMPLLYFYGLNNPAISLEKPWANAA